MQRIRTSFYIIIASLLFISASYGQDNAQGIDKSLSKAVVTVIAYDKSDNVLSRGTGFFVSDRGDLLTRRRVFPAGTYRSEVKTQDGNTYPIIIVAGDYKEADLVWAWVRVRPGSVKYLKVSSTSPQVGDQVLAISASSDHKVTEGKVVSVEDSSLGKIVQVQGSLPPGATGSPVINNQGEVAGIATFLKPDADSFPAFYGDRLLYWRMPANPKDSFPPNLFRGVAIKRVQPDYPQLARSARITGVVLVEVLVDEKGEVAAVRAISGPTELQEAAVAAAYQWRFSPTTKNGVANKVIGTITFNFTP